MANQVDPWAEIRALAAAERVTEALQRAQALEREANHARFRWKALAVTLSIASVGLVVVAAQYGRATPTPQGTAAQAPAPSTSTSSPDRSTPRLVKTAEDLAWFFQTDDGEAPFGTSVRILGRLRLRDLPGECLPDVRCHVGVDDSFPLAEVRHHQLQRQTGRNAEEEIVGTVRRALAQP